MLYQRCPDGTWETARTLPQPRLRQGVISYRGLRLELGRPRRRLEAPIGAVALWLGFGRRVRVTRSAGPSAWFDCCLAGLQTRASLGEHDGRLEGVEVMLAPWAAFALFGIPMHELSERAVDPHEVMGRRIDALVDALATAAGWATRFALLDAALERWTAEGPVVSAPVVRAWSKLARTGGALPIARLAADVGWGERQLENRFRDQIGLRPKAAARVVRLQRAMKLLDAGRPPAQVAGVCGFYDQAHFSGEFKAMTGRTPSEFTSERNGMDSMKAGRPMVDRLSGAVTSVLLSEAPGARIHECGFMSADSSKTGALLS
ncbi:helix-turn-helix domain-containing protein [Streptomyces sp. RB6PN25]|uniref:Helix-turn-helix domain-containing protein n=2 Tax=Streptomyces humicola TaxID=2953240 RepID=A0ABT1Q0K5_9ACTN|nr:helix-turn-helix domain-containing protein [Streptomyces humicola]